MTGSCSVANPGFYITNSMTISSCISIDPRCSTCRNGDGKCEVCQINFIIDNTARCILDCPGSQNQINEFGVNCYLCSSIDPRCTGCLDYSRKCTACQIGFKLGDVTNSPHICVPVCQQN